MKIKADRDAMEATVASAKANLAAGLPPDEDAEREWARREVRGSDALQSCGRGIRGKCTFLYASRPSFFATHGRLAFPQTSPS